MKKVLAILGPTAVGKTSLSIYLAQQLNGEVISGDSMQVYRGLDIGTAKVTAAEMDGVVHHLINIKNIDERYSVAEFVDDAMGLIDDITARGRLPILVGGTGFYAKALLYQMTLGGDAYDQDEKVRNKWREYLAREGAGALWQKLAQVDPNAAEAIPEANSRRVIRALEVYDRTGTLFSKQQDVLLPRYDAMVIGLNTERQRLYARINQRVDEMMTAGLLDEARWLFDQNGGEYQAGKGIGYREFWPFFAGQITQEDAVEAIKLDTRHYAKRQLTWLRHQLPVNWYDLVENPNQKTEILKKAANWLK